MLDYNPLEGYRDAQAYDLESLLHYNGFRIDAAYGDWQQGALTPNSRLMIYVSTPTPPHSRESVGKHENLHTRMNCRGGCRERL